MVALTRLMLYADWACTVPALRPTASAAPPIATAEAAMPSLRILNMIGSFLPLT